MAKPVTLTYTPSDTPKVYSYLRFSTPEQSKGDSRRRQTDMARSYAQERGLEVDETLSDEGLSAFRAKHLAEGGQLGGFIHAINLGLVAHGSVLLVENIDRLSRLPPWRTANLLSNIVQAGITVVTLNPFKEYTAAALDRESDGIMTFIEIALQAHRAHTESAEKGRRGRATWSEKRKKASAGEKITSVCPPWLTLNADRQSFRVNEARANVVRRIFRDTLNGIGSHSITAALNAEGVPAFSLKVDDEGQPIYSDDPEKAAKERARFWRRTYLATILKNPAVIGVQSAKSNDYTSGKRRKVKEGEVAGYFPAIITEADFAAVQSMRGTSSPRRGRHASREVSNIFGGLAVCVRCGASMVRVNKGQGRYQVYLVCEKAKSGAGCKYTAVPYRKTELAFVDALTFTLEAAPHGEMAESFREKRQNYELYLGVLADQYDDAFRSMRVRPSAETAQTLRRLEAERDTVTKHIEALEARQQRFLAPMMRIRVDELWDACLEEPMDRTKVNAVMRRLFARVEVDPDAKTITPVFEPDTAAPSIIYAPDDPKAHGFSVEPEGTFVTPKKSRKNARKR